MALCNDDLLGSDELRSLPMHLERQGLQDTHQRAAQYVHDETIHLPRETCSGMNACDSLNGQSLGLSSAQQRGLADRDDHGVFQEIKHALGSANRPTACAVINNHVLEVL